jgi:hypothetical protein
LYLAALKSPRAETLKAYLAAFPEGRFAESLTTQLRDVQTMATRDQCVEVYRRDVVDLFRRLRSMLPQGALFADGSYSVGPMVVGPGGTRPPEPRKLDPWGNEFTLEVRRGRGHVRSPGPDSKKWTDDDVRCPTEDVVLH